MKTSGVSQVGAEAPVATRGRRAWRITAAGLIAGSVLLASGCGHGSKSPSWQGGTQPAGGSSAGAGATSPAAALPSTVGVTSPAANATNALVITDVKFSSDDPENTTVAVTGPDGDVKGTLDKDGKSWTPDKSLDYGAKYTVTVTGPPAEGKNNTSTSTFTTMAKPSKTIRATSFLGDNNTVGVGMPLIVKFSSAVPVSYRDDVERRMTVTATPAQEGTWHWISPTEIHYRPKVFWQAHSKVFYKVQLNGVPLGDGVYGKTDMTVDINIGRQFIMTVSAKTKHMTVVQDGKVINNIPVSLGKASTPSSSGTMLVIEKLRHTVFDTFAELGPDKGYRDEIDYAQRITWSGQFIHAAPWSEGKQGKVNVSHGCVNVSEAMGAWLFSRTLMGDPITVKDTGDPLKTGNGWTDWNMSYDQYKKGSYL